MPTVWFSGFGVFGAIFFSIYLYFNTLSPTPHNEQERSSVDRLCVDKKALISSHFKGAVIR